MLTPKIITSEIKLQKTGAYYNNPKRKKNQYIWRVTTSCAEPKCRQLQISAGKGKILVDEPAISN